MFEEYKFFGPNMWIVVELGGIYNSIRITGSHLENILLKYCLLFWWSPLILSRNLDKFSLITIWL